MLAQRPSLTPRQIAWHGAGELLTLMLLLLPVFAKEGDARQRK